MCSSADVAALASGIPMVVDGQFTLTGGTSASTPEFSGIISLINDRRLAAGLKPLGFLNTRYGLSRPALWLWRWRNRVTVCSRTRALVQPLHDRRGAPGRSVLRHDDGDQRVHLCGLLLPDVHILHCSQGLGSAHR